MIQNTKPALPANDVRNNDRNGSRAPMWISASFREGSTAISLQVQFKILSTVPALLAIRGKTASRRKKKNLFPSIHAHRAIHSVTSTGTKHSSLAKVRNTCGSGPAR